MSIPGLTAAQMIVFGPNMYWNGGHRNTNTIVSVISARRPSKRRRDSCCQQMQFNRHAGTLLLLWAGYSQGGAVLCCIHLKTSVQRI